MIVLQVILQVYRLCRIGWGKFVVVVNLGFECSGLWLLQSWQSSVCCGRIGIVICRLGVCFGVIFDFDGLCLLLNLFLLWVQIDCFCVYSSKLFGVVVVVLLQIIVVLFLFQMLVNWVIVLVEFDGGSGVGILICLLVCSILLSLILMFGNWMVGGVVRWKVVVMLLNVGNICGVLFVR